jgi:hypothetical protein
MVRRGCMKAESQDKLPEEICMPGFPRPGHNTFFLKSLPAKIVLPRDYLFLKAPAKKSKKRGYCLNNIGHVSRL